MFKKIIHFLVVLFIGININSAEMFIGARPLSMANAYTSISGDIFSLFYNPAGLSKARLFSLSTDFCASYNFSGGLLYNVNNILSFAEKFSAIESAQKQGAGIDVTQVTALLDAMKNLYEISLPGKGMITTINGGLAFNIKNYGFSVRNYTILGLKPDIDTGFYLGRGTASTSSIHKVLSFTSTTENFGGIIIPSDSTGTVKTELLRTQQELKSIIENFLRPTLEKLGVEIPTELNADQIANALINIALANGVSDDEIKDAVSKLSDSSFQNFIKNFLESKDTTKNIFSNNQSGLLFKGLNVTELNLSYAREMFLSKLYIGGSIKYLIGTSIYYHFLVFDEKRKLDFNNIMDLQNKITKNSNAITVDLGTIYQISTVPIKTQVGLAIKNLLEPEFDLANTTEKLKLPRQIKVGCSTELLRTFTLAADYDLLKTKTFVPGYENQNLSLGFEFKLPILLSLRAGYLKNLAMAEDEMLSGGIGLRIFALNVDLSAMLSTKNVNIDNTIIVPTNAAVSLNVRLDF